MIQKLKKNLGAYYRNLKGWRTPRKIVVIESDDWGAIRMASKQAFDFLKKKGYEVDQCRYNSNDGIERNEDLEFLYETLAGFKDSKGSNPVITANTVMANPDFEKIKKAGFQNYFYEPFTETLKKYEDAGKVLNLYQQGIQNGLFFPQFHGREHVNINRWLLKLREGQPKLLDALNQGMFTVHGSGAVNGRRDYLDTLGLGYTLEDEVENIEDGISDGLAIFKSAFGYDSRSFIAPCFTWPENIEPLLKKHGVDFLQGMPVQKIPTGKNGDTLTKKRHYMGERNESNQRYLIRNVIFEPAGRQTEKIVEKALWETDVAFSMNKPAIISTHRLNFVSRINKNNRDQNLKLLQAFLNRLIQKHPDVEFMTTVELGDTILNDKEP